MKKATVIRFRSIAMMIPIVVMTCVVFLGYFLIWYINRILMGSWKKGRRLEVYIKTFMRVVFVFMIACFSSIFFPYLGSVIMVAYAFFVKDKQPYHLWNRYILGNQINGH